MFNTRWNVLIYAIMLAFFGIIASYMLYSKSEQLITNFNYQTTEVRSTKNVDTKASLAIKYDVLLNSDGSGFTDTKRCPTGLTLTNTSSGVTVFTLDTSPKYGASGIYCSTTYTGALSYSGEVVVNYATGYTAFSNIQYAGSTLALTGSPMVTPVFSGSGWSDYQFSFSIPPGMSGIDADGDSDNYSSTSSWAVSYPNGKVDNDALWRQLFFGYVKKSIWYVNAFWSNSATNAYVMSNPLNLDTAYARIGNTSTGYVYLNADGPYTIKIVEFDRSRYNARKELYALSQTGITATGAGQWYLQNSLSLSGSYGSTWATMSNAMVFDFKNKDYAFFLAYDGNATNSWADFLRYQIKVTNELGKGVFITPLQDANANEIRYLGNDIVIDRTGEFLAEQTEVIQKDPNSKAFVASSVSSLCLIGISLFWCTLGN